MLFKSMRPKQALCIDCDDVSFDTSKTNGSSKAKYKVFSGSISATENKIRNRRINLRSFLNTELEAEACEYALQHHRSDGAG